MRFPAEPRQGNGIPFQGNIPGRAFHNPPHPETATHYSAQNRVAFSRALDAGDLLTLAALRQRDQGGAQGHAHS